MPNFLETYTYGEYAFRGSYVININNEIERSAQSIVHEAHHLEFTTQTMFGNFLRMCKQISVIDPRYSYIHSHMTEHCRKSQEAACVFSELVFLTQSRSYSDAMQYLQYLRGNNKEYYKYVKPLLPFLDYLAENELSTSPFKIPCKEMFSVIKGIIYSANNIDLTTIDVERCKSEKAFTRFLEAEGHPQKYYPDSRFKTYIEEILAILKQGENKQALNDWFDKNLPDSSPENVQTWLNKAKTFLKELYQDTAFPDDISTVLEGYQIRQYDSISMIGTAIPWNYGQRYEMTNRLYDTASLRDFSTLCNEENGILLIFGRLTNALEQMWKRFYVPQQYRLLVKKRFCACVFFSFNQKKLYPLVCDVKNLGEVCLRIREDVPVAINYKSYNDMRPVFSFYQHPLYCYCDRSYTHAVDFINELTDGVDRQFAVLQYGEVESLSGLSVLLVELSPIRYFFLPMPNISQRVLERDLEEHRIHLSSPMTFPDDIIQSVDALTNCLLYL